MRVLAESPGVPGPGETPEMLPLKKRENKRQVSCCAQVVAEEQNTFLCLCLKGVETSLLVNKSQLFVRAEKALRYYVKQVNAHLL